MGIKYAICYNPKIENSATIAEKLDSILKSKNIKTEILSIDNLSTDCDFAFIVGGDGTILKAARFYAKAGIPIFGINLGHLGFLSQASETDIKKSIEQIVESNYKIEERIMLQ